MAVVGGVGVESALVMVVVVVMSVVAVVAVVAVMVLVELWFVVRQVLRISLGFYEWATAQAS